MKEIYEINGENFSTLEEFAGDFTEKLNLRIHWNGNLDAFNDILRGGFGTPDEGFILIWKNSDLSKKRLGYVETIRQLEKRIANCYPSNKAHFEAKLDEAKQQKSSTVFDWLVDIIQDEEHNDIELRLE